MCWKPDAESRLYKAERDLTVYKAVVQLFNIRFFRSYHREFIYEMDKTYENDVKQFDNAFTPPGLISMDGQAFHSWRLCPHQQYLLNESTVAVRCTIPKGSSWSINADGEVVSSSIRIDAIVEAGADWQPCKTDQVMDAEKERLNSI